MIHVVTQENAHLFGDIMPSMYRLRYRAFIERQDYNVSSIRKMEYDAYDTPAAVYLICRENTGVVGGCTRLSPTDRPYMIEDIWPELIEANPIPKSESIWEASRFCIDKGIAPERRREIHLELLCGMQEFGLQQKLNFMIGVMQPPIWKRIFINVGWPIEFLGDPKALDDREKIIAGRMPISEEILFKLRSKISFFDPVIVNSEDYFLQGAA